MERKAAALLDLTGQGQGYIDIPFAITLSYIGNLNGMSIPIFDTQSDIGVAINLLDTLYAQGFRVFIGFSDCTMLTGVLPWFMSHQDTLGISPYSSCTTGEVVGKNIIRLNLSDRFSAFFIANFIETRAYDTVVFIGPMNIRVAVDFVGTIKGFIPSGTVNIVEVNTRDITFDQTSQETIQVVMSQLLKAQETGSNTIEIPSVQEDGTVTTTTMTLGGTGVGKMCMINLTFGDLSDLIGLLTQVQPNGVTYDIIDPNNADIAFSRDEAAAVEGHYYHFQVDQAPDTTNMELEQILGTDFSYNAYDAYNIARLGTIYSEQGNMQGVYSAVDHLLGHNGFLQLNNFNDRKYGYYKVTLWQNNMWNLIISQGNDTVFGVFISYITLIQRQL